MKSYEKNWQKFISETKQADLDPKKLEKHAKELEKEDKKEKEKEEKQKQAAVKKATKAAPIINKNPEVKKELEKLVKDPEIDFSTILDQIKALFDSLMGGLGAFAGGLGFGSDEPADKPAAAAPTPTIKYSAANMSPFAKANNEKWFGNPAGSPGKGMKSSITSARRYNKKLNFSLGAIPFTKDMPAATGENPKAAWRGNSAVGIPQKWIGENIGGSSAGGMSYQINKQCAPSLKAAIDECQQKYQGLPMVDVGGFVVKGKRGGFSSHAWGAAIDFDSRVNPYSRGGLLSPAAATTALAGRGGTSRYHNIKNPQGTTWLEYLKTRRGQKADPLYVFVAGQYGANGIAAIFKKHGWSWGGNYRGLKDGMHFEYLG